MEQTFTFNHHSYIYTKIEIKGLILVSGATIYNIGSTKSLV